MPARPKTSDAAIVQAARQILERDGGDRFSLDAVAAAVGVRTPSLYKRIADRASLLATLEQVGFRELGDAVCLASTGPHPLRAMAHAYRRFALGAPQLYARMMSPDATRTPASEKWRRDAAAPLLDLLRARGGDRDPLADARLLTAFLHGWVSMESAGAFRLGGDIENDFARAVDSLVAHIRAISDEKVHL